MPSQIESYVGDDLLYPMLNKNSKGNPQDQWRRRDLNKIQEENSKMMMRL
jgi:hypothetical protein